MSLDAIRLRDTIKQAFIDAGANNNPALVLLSKGLAEAIINEFKNNAELTITGPPFEGTIK